MKRIILICSVFLIFGALTACTISGKKNTEVAAGGVVGGVATVKAQ